MLAFPRFGACASIVRTTTTTMTSNLEDTSSALFLPLEASSSSEEPSFLRLHCALSPASCDYDTANEYYMRPDQVDEALKQQQANRHSDEEEYPYPCTSAQQVILGQCRSNDNEPDNDLNDDRLCAASPESCPSGTWFHYPSRSTPVADGQQQQRGKTTTSPNDEICNLVTGQGDFGYTLFPSCGTQDASSSAGRRCVLWKSDCSETSSNWIPIQTPKEEAAPSDVISSPTMSSSSSSYNMRPHFDGNDPESTTTPLPPGDNEDDEDGTATAAWQDSSCHCHDVATGLCQAKAEAGTTADDFCAVSSADCPPETHDFVTALALLEQQQQSSSWLQCRLCPDTRYRVGACVNSVTHEFLQCAKEAWECQDLASLEEDSTSPFSSQLDAAQFVSAVHQVSNSEGQPQACFTQDLRLGLYFQQEQQESVVQSGSTTTTTTRTTFTYFGQCQNVTGGDNNNIETTTSRCVWDGMECDFASGEEWKIPPRPSSRSSSSATEPLPLACLCEDVYTGACEYAPGLYHCAVSPQACDDPTTYVRAWDVSNNSNTSYRDAFGQVLDCRLCPLRPASMLVLPSLPPTSSPLPSSGGTDEAPPSDTADDTAANGDDDMFWSVYGLSDDGDAALALLEACLIAVGLTLAVMAVLVLIRYTLLRDDPKKKTAKRDQSPGSTRSELEDPTKEEESREEEEEEALPISEAVAA
ncbi:hypothetical protein ACA910_021489 [Epithemia clementina (nom. ined.)]